MTPLLGLAVATLLLFRDALFGRGMLYERDIHLIWWAEIEQFVRTVAQGAWPLWDVSYGSGQPMLAVPETQVLYPPQWINLIVAPAAAYASFAAGHIIASATGVYFLCRQLRLRRAAALAGAGVWAFSGPLLSLVNVWHHFSGAAWIPWTTLLSERYLATGRRRTALLWALAVGLQILAGSGEMVAMSAGLSGILVLRTLVNRSRLVSRRRIFAGVGLVYGIGLGVSAALWLPAMELVHHSSRSTLGEAARAAWSLHPWSLLELVLPVCFNNLPLLAATRRALFEGREPFLLSVYLGLPALALAQCGVVGRRSDGRILGLVVLASIAIAMGSHLPVFSVLTALVPALSIFRYPTKVLIVTAWAWALLAAYGTHAVVAAGAARRYLAFLCVVLALAAGATALGGEGLLAPLLVEGGRAHLASRLAMPLACLVALLIVLAVPWRQRLRTPLAALLALIPMADLAVVNSKVNPTASPLVYSLRPPLVNRLRQDPTPKRLFVYDYQTRSLGRQLLTHPHPRMQQEIRESPYFTRFPQPGFTDDEVRALAYQLYLLPPLPGRWGLASGLDEDMKGLFRHPSRAFLEMWRATDTTPAATRMLRLAGITHVITLHKEGWFGLEHLATEPNLFYASTHLFRVPNTLPRVYWVAVARTVTDDQWFDALLSPEFDPAQEVLVAADSGPLATLSQGHGRATLLQEWSDRMLIETEASAAGYVVVLDTFDPGWKVRVDGASTALLRANLAFRAIPVPEGRHAVELRYRPRAVLIGLAVSGLTLVLATALWLFAGRSERSTA